MIDRAALELRLSRLEAAKDEVLFGKGVVTITDGTKSMTYNKAKLSELNAAIREVKTALGFRRRAIGVSFGR